MTVDFKSRRGGSSPSSQLHINADASKDDLEGYDGAKRIRLWA